MTNKPRPRRRRFGLAQLHRWLAIALSPVLALILLSGIVLAFRPIVGGEERAATTHRVPVDPRRLAAVIDSVDPRATAMGFWLDDQGALHLFAPGAGFPAVDVGTGKRAVDAAPPVPTFWDDVHRVHVQLWIGAEGLVVLGTIAMIFLVLAGPFLSRPRRPRSARSWHVWMGWTLWPLLALLPFSVVMMKIHPPIRVQPGAPLPALGRVVERAAAGGLDVTRLRGVQGLPGGTAIVMFDGGPQAGRWLLDGTKATNLHSRVADVGHALHEGTWAGPWSAALNIVAAIASLAMLGSGLLSWRRARRRRMPADEGLARAA